MIDYAKLSARSGSIVRKPLKPVPSRSVAVWPDTISVGNVAGKNKSSDTHDSADCQGLFCETDKYSR